MDTNKVIEKIKRLQALANNNQNEHEVLAATSAANKLIQEHRISLAELESAGNVVNDPLVKETLHSMSNRSEWRETILTSLCGSYGACFYIASGHSNEKDAAALQLSEKTREMLGIKLVGSERTTKYIVCARKSDYDVLAYMFEYIIGQAERLCKEASRGNGVAFAKSYLSGFAQGVAAQFNETKRLADAFLLAANSSSAMVLLGNRQSEAKSFMKSNVKLRNLGSLTGGRSNSDGRSQGYSDGRNVNVNKGIGGGGSSKGRLGQ